jgi:hypothetical protein
MRQKKRYVLLKSYPTSLPPNTKFLFQNQRGFVFKTDLKGAETLRSSAKLISGSIWKLKEPKPVNSSNHRKKDGMK